MGKKGLPIETFADNSIIDRLVREGFIRPGVQKTMRVVRRVLTSAVTANGEFLLVIEQRFAHCLVIGNVACDRA